jgi:hypothetical protein
MIRSLLSVAALGWFAYNAMSFLPSAAYFNDGASGGIDGDPGAVAVTWAARTLFVGLAIMSLAMVDWAWLGHSLRSLTDLPAPDASDIRER